MKIKKVAITGVAGFVGANLVKACLLKGWDVIGVDNLSTGKDEMADPIRVMSLPGFYSFIKLDINETEKLTEVFAGCDVVFHLAAVPRVSYSVEHPMESDYNNGRGTLSVLEAALRAGVKRVVFSGSSSVYGGVAKLPTDEKQPSHVLSPYALQKDTGAEYCRLYSELYSLDTCVLQYFNLFGPLQFPNSAYSTVVTAFFDCAMKGETCRVDGDGENSRDFTFVEDAVSANILSAEYDGKLKGERFNIATGKAYSVLDVFEEVKKLTNCDLKKRHVAPRLGDPRKSLADISKAKKVLGYNPKFDFHSGMIETYEWWRARNPNIWGK